MTEKIRVLHAEDEDSIRKVMSKMIARLLPNAIVQSTPSAEKALEALKGTRPDIVITDYDMLKLTGGDLAQKVREHYPGTPVLLTTGRSVDECIFPFQPGDMYVEKPFDVGELVSRIPQILSLAQREPERVANAKAIYVPGEDLNTLEKLIMCVMETSKAISAPPLYTKSLASRSIYGVPFVHNATPGEIEVFSGVTINLREVKQHLGSQHALIPVHPENAKTLEEALKDAGIPAHPYDGGKLTLDTVPKVSQDIQAYVEHIS